MILGLFRGDFVGIGGQGQGQGYRSALTYGGGVRVGPGSGVTLSQGQG